MKRGALLTCLLACLLATSPARSADLDDVTVAGNLQAVWMLQQKADARTLYRRPVGQKAWDPLGVQPTGKILHLQPVSGDLHLLFEGGAYAWISQGERGSWDYSTGVNVPGRVLAIAEASGLPKTSAAGLVAAVKLEGPPPVDAISSRESIPAEYSEAVPPLATAPASQPATASAPATAPASQPTTGPGPWTAVYVALAGRWTLVHAEPGELRVDDIIYAAGKPWLVRYASDGTGRTEVRAFDAEDPWRPLNFAASAPTGAIASHLILLPETQDAPQSPVLVSILPAGVPASQPTTQAASQPAAGPYVVQVRTVDLAQRTAAEAIAVHHDHKTLEFPSAPRVLLVGRQIGLLWQGDGQIEMALASESASLGSREDVSKALDDLDRKQLGTKIQFYFLTVVLGAVVLSVLILRPQVRSPVFSLPENLAPASLPRRVLAFVIDFLPFQILAGVLISMQVPADVGENMEKLTEYAQTYPPELVATAIGTLLAFVAYTTIMELRTSQTLGKKLLRLAVVGELGLSPSVRSILTRNIMKIFELLLIGNALAGQFWLLILLAVIPFATQYRQRLGDMAGRTAVIDLRLTRPTPPPDEAASPGGSTDQAARRDDGKPDDRA